MQKIGRPLYSLITVIERAQEAASLKGKTLFAYTANPPLIIQWIKNDALKNFNLRALIKLYTKSIFPFTTRAELIFTVSVSPRSQKFVLRYTIWDFAWFKVNLIEIDSGLSLRQHFWRIAKFSFTRLMWSRDNERGMRAKVMKIEKIKSLLCFRLYALRYIWSGNVRINFHLQTVSGL